MIKNVLNLKLEKEIAVFRGDVKIGENVFSRHFKHKWHCLESRCNSIMQDAYITARFMYGDNEALISELTEIGKKVDEIHNKYKNYYADEIGEYEYNIQYVINRNNCTRSEAEAIVAEWYEE